MSSGGRSGTGTYSNEVYEYDGSTWTLRTNVGTPPSARSGVGLAYDTARSVLVMACGQPEGASCDTWELGSTWARITTTASPAPRHYMGSGYHVARGRTMLANGTQGSSTTLATSTDSDGASWFSVTPAPSARGWVTMTYDSTRGKMVLFGGYGGSAYLGDTWEY